MDNLIVLIELDESFEALDTLLRKYKYTLDYSKKMQILREIREIQAHLQEIQGGSYV